MEDEDVAKTPDVDDIMGYHFRGVLYKESEAPALRLWTFLGKQQEADSGDFVASSSQSTKACIADLLYGKSPRLWIRLGNKREMKDSDQVP
jgi:hypothetical protein